MNASVSDLVVSVAAPPDAAAMVEVIHAAFGARPPLDPPSTASAETPESVARSIVRGGGILATVHGRPAGAILVLPDDTGRVATFQRVSVHPELQRHGIASAMVAAAEELAATQGYHRVELFARQEFAELIAFWQHRGFVRHRSAPYGVVLAKPLPVAIRVPTSDQMHALGVRLARLLRPGDLVIASGELGAGKTTLTQGIGEGLDAIGPIISPTFVLSRIHPSRSGRPPLVHVDAYRLSTSSELDDLDLDATAAESVTVVEWGQGLAEGLASDRLELDIWTALPEPVAPDPSGDTSLADDRVYDGAGDRVVTLRPVGARWCVADLAALAAEVDQRG